MTGEAFAQAVQTYGDTVYRVAFHALNSREDAEDVMQTVMLKLFEYDKEFVPERFPDPKGGNPLSDRQRDHASTPHDNR